LKHIAREEALLDQIYVVGGRTRPELSETGKEWNQFGAAVVVGLDPASVYLRRVCLSVDSMRR
jgi:hypothetical protein